MPPAPSLSGAVHDPQHTLTTLAVSLLQRLHPSSADGAVLDVDLAPIIQSHQTLAALYDPALFASAHLDARGGYVVWTEEDLELAADNLRNLAIEQAGGKGHERLWNWMHDNSLTQARAAEAIGISRRMLNYYVSGAKPIPKTVWLACVGWMSEQLSATCHKTNSSAAVERVVM
jgi:predicted XRE-type DNA-binding protein